MAERPFRSYRLDPRVAFLVVHIVDGQIRVIHEKPTIEEAIDDAVQIATAYCTSPVQAIRSELLKEHDFLCTLKNSYIYIVTLVESEPTAR